MNTVYDRGAAPMQEGARDPDIHTALSEPWDDDMDCCEVCALPADQE